MNSNIKVLLVDDDRIIRDCITAFLEDEGFAVLTAPSAEIALEMLAVEKPQVCITDLRLTGMNGEQLIIAAKGAGTDCRFLIHSGANYDISEELIHLGMGQYDVLNKPVYKLAQFTENIIRAHRGGGEP